MAACENLFEHGDTLSRVLPLSEVRATYVWAGSRPLTVLRGLKTPAFYRAIMGDEDQRVIDSIMLQVMGWSKRHSLSLRQYERLGRLLAEAAAFVDEPTTRFQAVVWCGQRGGGG